ncbi:cation-independent mannose-6-phosphate receptor-like [Patiria miniata]|uniref:MRH domain-containing protein n=1 Tax=Patiria miniata TaxID=46514 RepID=A0A913Z8M1_PATMI|nr:cation-independent mannose-6-phosphate receptor-like [Patiria miniata]XP_038048005.1 cation-independent mannose-6-phosphate receptor-like [Patiria miniata]
MEIFGRKGRNRYSHPDFKSASAMNLLVIFILFVGKAVADTCVAGDFDLTPIQNWKTWTLRTEKLATTSSMFYMNLCDTIQATGSGNACSSDSSMCLKMDQTYTKIGNHNQTLLPTANAEGGGFRLDYRGDECANSTQTPKEKWQTTIDFKCDKTLGSPIFIERSGCTYFFEWHSTVACKNLATAAVHEVPCSVYDNNNKKRDLTPLIKQQGGYKVDSDATDQDLYINVCRDITPDEPTADCPSGSAACRITHSTGADGAVTHSVASVGEAFHRLQTISHEQLELRYNVSTTPADCLSSPQVTIEFVCPREDGRNEGSQNPKLLSSTNCHYEVQWVTEFACEAEMLTTDTCAFTNDKHGIDLDLSPLTDKQKQHPKVAEASGYKYWMDVCQDMAIGCLDEDHNGAVCQESVPGGNRLVAGVSKNHVLSYADGELTLTYKGGDVCNHNQFPRTSVISFECNKTAGVGNPTFVTETECTYLFEWQTEYACLDHPLGKTCRVDVGNQHYDLSPLVREFGSNWQALDGQHDHSATTEGEYFINVCAEILPEGLHDHPPCPEKSAACLIAHGDNAISLGQYKESPVFRNGHITLTYYNGTDCNGKAMTVITFICAYGDLESAPSFVRKSLDGCMYEFEWRTAAACPLGHKWGTDCRVFDDDAGFSFDLSRLTSATKYYNMTGGDYDYYINVCAPIVNTPCNEEGIADAAACQVKKDSTAGDKWVLGRVNKTLEYFDGVVKLTYLNGDPYHVQDGLEPPKRRTEIAFLCAPDQDPGYPTFKYEADNAYVFNWYTKYACPEDPIECVVTDEETHTQYDLSSLSKSLEEDNWSFVDDSDPQGNRKKYYINVCRPVNPVKGCGAFAGACQTEFNNNQEVLSISSLGVPKSKPVIESQGHLLLTYVNGSACNGGQGQVESRIHFSCRKGVLGSSPRLLEKVNDCLYSFIWETEAACTIDATSGEDCTVKDPNSEYVFNMQTLVKPDGFYEVPGPSGTLFQLNICDNVTGGDSHCVSADGTALSSCKIAADGSTAENIGKVSKTLKFSDDGLLTLSYQGKELDTGFHLKTEITFLCRHNVSLSAQKPTFHRQEGNTYIFNFETPLACLPESVDCLVSDDKGNQYDLSSLAKDDGNWEAVDTRPKMTMSYYINVCRPVNSLGTDTQFCPGGPIGACQTTADSKAFNMGYVQAMPEAAVDGSLSIRYVNGDLCHGKYHRSTRINFECSTTPGSPVFELETDSCEYIFTWETPAACPLQRVTGSECKVQVPNYEFQYDLTLLHNTETDYVVSVPPYEYRINVCGPLVAGEEECNVNNVGACQKKTGDQGFIKNAGMFNQKLQYNDGSLKLNYTTGVKNCHSNTYERSTAINFFCDEGIQGNGEPTFIQEDSDCTYIFEWATPQACPPFKVVECSYSDRNQQFDLASLARVDDNYRIDPMATVGTDVYYINVCRSLLHKTQAQGSSCPHNAAACLKQGDKYFNLGEVIQGPTMESGHLVLRYESGDPCPSGGGAKRSSIVSLECDKEGVGSTPQYSYTSDNCEYHFIWLTNLACTINNETEVLTDDCTAVNPATGFKFDLNILKSAEGYTVNSDKGHQYLFSLCAPLQGSPCEGDNIGSCQTEKTATNPRSFSSGSFNRKLHYHDGTLFLNYEDGAPCHNNAFTRSTIINFVCSLNKGAIGEPVFVDESEDCTYYISWHTTVVCEEFIQCNVINGSRVIDLSPLVSDRGYYLANSLTDDDDEKQYYINLCRPLNPIPGVRCPPGSAACLDKGNGQVNLGRVSEGPKIVEGRVVMSYAKGDVCPEDNSKNISTVITLLCERGTSQGTPTMDSYSECTYHFSWLTNAVCPPAKSSPGKDCKYYDDRLQYEYDLSSLAETEKQVTGPDNSIYNVRLCNAVSDSSCQDSSVCLHDGDSSFSLGTVESQMFLIEGHILKLQYSSGSLCEQSASKKRKTTIIFKCSETVKPNQPTFFSSDNACNYMFQWETPLACPPLSMPCDLAYMEKIFDLQPLSLITGSWQFQDDGGNKYYMNLCQPAFNTPDGCPKEASICRQRPNGKIDILGMIYTQLLNAEGKASDPSIQISFRGGSPGVCGNAAVAGSDIILTCANVVGRPKLKSVSTANDADCTFTFVWESKVACSEERVAVVLKDGKVTDPETMSTFDLSPLIKHSTWQAEGDERDEKSGQQSVYMYYISLGSAGSQVDGDTNGECSTAAVCQSKKDDPFFRNIGDVTKEKFFMKDEILEMVITNPNSCGKEDTEDVETTIVFRCDPSVALGQPRFDFESVSCQYYFIWTTSAMCSTLTPTEAPNHNGGSGGKGDKGGTDGPASGSGSKIPAVIGILAGVVVLCLLIIVFHKSERRSAVYYKLRGFFPGAYSKVPTYSYSQLSNGDVEESLLGQSNARGIYSDDEDEDLLKDNSRGNPIEYRDDSDEEILPSV